MLSKHLTKVVLAEEFRHVLASRDSVEPYVFKKKKFGLFFPPPYFAMFAVYFCVQ